MKDFGVRLSKMRMVKNLTQEDIACKMGVSRTSIAKYENGTQFPSVETLIQLADVLDCSTDWLLGRNNDRKVAVNDIEYEIRCIETMLDRVKEITCGR